MRMGLATANTGSTSVAHADTSEHRCSAEPVKASASIEQG
jgi:hypothetical protein